MILVKKLKFFHLLYLSKIDREKVFADVLDKKEAFKDYKKTTVYQKPKIRIFPKGLVHRNRSLYWTFYIKKQVFLDYENIVFKKRQNC